MSLPLVGDRVAAAPRTETKDGRLQVVALVVEGISTVRDEVAPMDTGNPLVQDDGEADPSAGSGPNRSPERGRQPVAGGSPGGSAVPQFRTRKGPRLPDE